jgi:hypothetical protein
VEEGWLLCHWWREIVERIIIAMTIIVILAALTALAVLAAPFGTDSRRLNDDTYDRDSLWSR